MENIKRCNCCGKELIEKNGILQEDILEVFKEWGYFSKKDLKNHYFLICEKCYDDWTKNFKISVNQTEKSEAMSG